jgi:hypothetical protein
MLQIEVSEETYYRLGVLKNRFKTKTWPQFADFLGKNAIFEENRISFLTDEEKRTPDGAGA